MRVEKVTVEDVGGAVRLTAVVGGEPLYFEVASASELAPTNHADAFLVMALGPAMLAGSPVEVAADPVSPVLLDNLSRVQEIYNSWNPKYRKVPIRAAVQDPGPPSDDVLTTYSAGVDSMHALIKHRTELTGAVMIAGFDMEPDAGQVREALERNRRVLEARGLALRFVTTNQRVWGLRFKTYRPLLYSGYLAATCLGFGPRRLYIPSGFPYGFPAFDGSQPYLDPLWSNGRTEVQQTGGEADRTTKVRMIVEAPTLTSSLRVCFRSQNENCGRCVKCLRTMVTFRILGQQGPFPRVISLPEIRGLALREDHDLYFATDNARLAAEAGDRDTLRAIQHAIRRYDRTQVLIQLDRWLFRGWLRRTRQRRRDYYDGLVPFVSRPDLDL
jgi:hypothetical protein